MEASRRLIYLERLGVTQWVPRAPAARATAAVGASVGEATPGHEPAAGPLPTPESNPQLALDSYRAPEPAETEEPTASDAAAPLAARAQPAASDPGGLDWEALARTVSGCRACGLCETRTQTVFGVGNRGADLMVIGEAPGADEDRQGEPFVGRAGKLLDLMLAAMGQPRERVYIANILKCRPPGNRDPQPEEARRCRPFLERQIALVRPRLILSVGRISAQNLLDTDTPVGELRGRWHAFAAAGVAGEIPLRVSYHPAYLLRSPEQKARAWEDLTAVARRLAES